MELPYPASNRASHRDRVAFPTGQNGTHSMLGGSDLSASSHTSLLLHDQSPPKDGAGDEDDRRSTVTATFLSQGSGINWVLLGVKGMEVSHHVIPAPSQRTG